jgi:hypothetical protein
MTISTTARLAVDDWPISRNAITDTEALSMLHQWHSDGARLGFGYFRSGAGVMQTGSATLLRVGPRLLTLDTGGSHLAVILDKARFEFGNLGFLKPDFRGIYDVEGLSVFLGNNDWLCLFSDVGDLDVSRLTEQFGGLIGPR